MARQLTAKQQVFLNVLFDEAEGNMAMAKKLAGYSDTSSTSEIIKGLKEEILEATQMYMARNAPKAAVAMTGALNNPTELGIRDKMTAAKELLDRVGLVKTEKMQVEASGGVMLMPPKAVVEDDD
tara:strand:+ start:201 stop:575 length:375 start_codon:yes stop_codon:yes gene_type:complete